VADHVPASSASSTTALASFNCTDAHKSVDPSAADFVNTLLNYQSGPENCSHGGPAAEFAELSSLGDGTRSLLPHLHSVTLDDNMLALRRIEGDARSTIRLDSKGQIRSKQ
jgi:hypothetical protein